MPDKTDLVTRLTPVLDALADVDPADPDAAARLNAALPMDGPVLDEIRALLADGLDAGWLTPREANGVRFGRVAKDAHGYSIDAVDMDGAGPGHTHPNGEFDLCFAWDGAPTFDGQPPGWVVYPPGHWHIPTVSGGRMVILYFLPGGAIRFEPKPA